MSHTTLSRTNSPQPTYFLDGKRIDNHTFINLLKLAVRAGIEPKDTDSVTEWNIANVPSEAIEKAKRLSTERFAAL